jgi:hypothetical protein
MLRVFRKAPNNLAHSIIVLNGSLSEICERLVSGSKFT